MKKICIALLVCALMLQISTLPALAKKNDGTVIAIDIPSVKSVSVAADKLLVDLAQAPEKLSDPAGLLAAVGAFAEGFCAKVKSVETIELRYKDKVVADYSVGEIKSKITKGYKDAAKSLGEAGRIIGKAYDDVRDAYDGSELQKAVDKAVSDAKPYLKEAGSLLKQAAGKLGEAAGEVYEDFKGYLSENGEDILDAAGKGIKGAGSKIGGALKGLFG